MEDFYLKETFETEYFKEVTGVSVCGTINSLYNPYLNETERNRLAEEIKLLKPEYACLFVMLMDFTRFLKDRHQLYMLKGLYNNSYILYKLGVTSINPIEFGLPYELLFESDICSFEGRLSIPEDFYDEFYMHMKEFFQNAIYLRFDPYDELKYIDNESISLLTVPLREKHLSGIINIDGRECFDDTYFYGSYPIIDFYVEKSFDLYMATKYISRHGYPDDLFTNEIVNNDIFVFNRTLALPSVDSYVFDFDFSNIDKDLYPHYYTKLVSLSYSNELWEVLASEMKDIGVEIIENYPVNLDELYNLLVDNGIDKEKALRIVYLTDYGHETREKYNDEWNDYKMLLELIFGEEFVSYLEKCEFLLSKANALELTHLGFLEMHHKEFDPDDYYEKLIPETFFDLEGKTIQEIENLKRILNSEDEFEAVACIDLYLEYRKVDGKDD